MSEVTLQNRQQDESSKMTGRGNEGRGGVSVATDLHCQDLNQARWHQTCPNKPGAPWLNLD